MAGMASRAAKATICWDRLDKQGSAPTRSAPARRSRIVANAASISLAELALRTNNCWPSLRATSCFALHARGFRKFRIQQHRNHRSIGDEFVQQVEPFAGDQ